MLVLVLVLVVVLVFVFVLVAALVSIPVSVLAVLRTVAEEIIVTRSKAGPDRVGDGTELGQLMPLRELRDFARRLVSACSSLRPELSAQRRIDPILNFLLRWLH